MITVVDNSRKFYLPTGRRQFSDARVHVFLPVQSIEVNMTGCSMANDSPGDDAIDLDFDSTRPTPLRDLEYPIQMLTASFLSSTMTSVHFGVKAVTRYRHHVQILSVRIEPLLCNF